MLNMPLEARGYDDEFLNPNLGHFLGSKFIHHKEIKGDGMVVCVKSQRVGLNIFLRMFGPNASLTLQPRAQREVMADLQTHAP